MQFEFMAYTICIGSKEYLDTPSLGMAKANALNLMKKHDAVSLKYNGKVFAKYEKKGKKFYYTSVNTKQKYEIDSKGNKIEGHPVKTVKTVKSKTPKTKPVVKNELGVKVGDIFYASWGYDQTNIDYYQIVGVTEKGCYIRPIGAKRIHEKDEWGSDALMPAKDHFIDGYDPFVKDPKKGAFKRTMRSSYSGVYLNMSSYANAYKWDGRVNYQTAFGFGH